MQYFKPELEHARPNALRESLSTSDKSSLLHSVLCRRTLTAPAMANLVQLHSPVVAGAALSITATVLIWRLTRRSKHYQVGNRPNEQGKC